MKHSKKWISSALVLSLSVGLSACGNANDKKKGKSSGASSTAVECSDSVTEALNAVYATAWRIALGDAMADAMKGLDSPESINSDRPKYEAELKAELKKLVGQPDCRTVVLLSGEALAYEAYSFPKTEGDIDSYATGLITKFKEKNAKATGTNQPSKKSADGVKAAGSPKSSGLAINALEACSAKVKTQYIRLTKLEIKIDSFEEQIVSQLEELDSKSEKYAVQVESLARKGIEALEDDMRTLLVEAHDLHAQNLGAPSCTIELSDSSGTTKQEEVGFSKDQADLDTELRELGTKFRAQLDEQAKQLESILEEIRNSHPSKQESAPTNPIAAPTKPAAAPVKPAAAPVKPAAAPVKPAAAPVKPAAAPAKPAAAQAKPAAAPAKPAAAQAKPIAAPTKPAAAQAKKTKILPPLCESSLIAAVKQFRKQAVEPFNNIENLNKAEVIKRTDKFLDHTAAFLRDYIGHHDCLMVKNKPGSLEEFPKSEKELQEIFSEAKEQFKKLAEKDLKDLKNTLKAMASEDN